MTGFSQSITMAVLDNAVECCFCLTLGDKIDISSVGVSLSLEYDFLTLVLQICHKTAYTQG